MPQGHAAKPAISLIGRSIGYDGGIGFGDSDVGCTWVGDCIAVATDWSPPESPGWGGGPPSSAVAMWSDRGGPWHRLRAHIGGLSWVNLDLSSCVHDGCLLVGQGFDGDVVWRFQGSSHHLVSTAAPTGGSGILAVSCWGAGQCLIADTRGLETVRHSVIQPLPVRFFETTNFGASWHLDAQLTDLKMTSIAAGQGGTFWDYGVDAISCLGPRQCVVADSGATIEALNARGSNAGVSSSWLVAVSNDQVFKTFVRNQLVTAVQCFSNGSCEALATGHFDFETLKPTDAWLTFDGGRRWFAFPSVLPSKRSTVYEALGAQEFTCPQLGECVMIDQHGGIFQSSGASWQLREPGGWGFSQVSCGAQWCVAGNTVGPTVFPLREAPSK